MPISIPAKKPQADVKIPAPAPPPATQQLDAKEDGDAMVTEAPPVNEQQQQ